MKKVLLDFNADFFKPQNTSAYEKISLLLETYEPEKEVQVIVERDKTGLQHLKPFLYNNYYYGVRPCLDDHNGLSTGFTMQVFGVDLDEICGFAKRNVPLFLVKLLRSVVRESDIQVKKPFAFHYLFLGANITYPIRNRHMARINLLEHPIHS